MEHRQFEAVVADTLERLPDWVLAALDNVAILVVDGPEDAPGAMREDLLGLYVGLPLPERSVEYAGELPDVIYIFRRPHLDLGLAPDELCEEVAKTLIHEIAHYFGFDDDHLDDIGWG